jgi:CO dehydrogenase nickel-insertion accessory protein CooC1
MEHLSRRTTRTSDVLFVVSDASKAALESAVRIAALAREMNLGIERMALVRNMVAPSSDLVDGLDGFDAVHSVRNSAAIDSGSVESESLLEIPQHDPAYQDIAKAVDEERGLARR